MSAKGIMKAAFIPALSLFATVFVSGCAPAVSLAQTPISFTTISKGFSSGIREPLQMVIRSPDEWGAFWGRHMSNKKGPTPAPNIDFASEMVIALFPGEKSTGGYAVEIVKIESDGPTIRVYYKELKPPPGAIVIQALTQPYHLVRVPKHEASVNFSHESS